MPREGTHWAILENTLSGLEEEGSCPALVRVLHGHRAAAYWGAVYPDVPYYLERDPEFEKIADHLHGVWRTDTFDPIRALSHRVLSDMPAVETLPAACWAFIIGGITHVIADSVFHPLIVYYTGNYYESDIKIQNEVRRRHRLIESYLDIWVADEYQIEYAANLNQALQDLKVGERCIAEFLANSIAEYLQLQAGLAEVNTVDRWLSGLAQFKKRQSQFRSPGFAIFVRLLNLMSGRRFSAEEAMFLPGRKHYAGALDAKISYRCPVNGTPFQHSFRDLFCQSVERCIDVVKLFEPLAEQSTETLTEEILNLKGDSMDLGSYRVASEDARFFSDKGLEYAGLEGACPSYRPGAASPD